MPFGMKKGKGKGLNLDCVLGNATITVVTCCGYIFQGVIVEEDDDKTRAQYGYPVVFPGMAMDCDHDKDDHKKDCKDDDHKDDKKHHCPKPIEVICKDEPKFICLRLECPPAFVCCDNDTTPEFAAVVPVGVTAGGTLTSLFDSEATVLISLDDIAAIGPSRGCLIPD